MKPVLQVLVSVAVLGALGVWVGGPRRGMIDHTQTVPILRAGEPLDYAAILAKHRPELILMGNSILARAVEKNVFEERIAIRTVKVNHGGAASAMWFLLLKNLVVPAEPRPRTVALFFRSVYLTEPMFRVQEQFKERIDFYAGQDEPELDRIAYLEGMDPLTLALSRHWSLYQRRHALKRRTETFFKTTLVGRLSGLTELEIRTAVNGVFNEEELLDEQVDEAQVAGDLDLQSEHHFDFETRVQASFLPLMLALAKENGVRLVFVRMRTRLDARGVRGENAPGGRFVRKHLPGYVESLRAYVEDHGALFLDMSGDRQIRLEHFWRGDHLNKVGRAIFTAAVADELRPLLRGEDDRSGTQEAQEGR